MRRLVMIAIGFSVAGCAHVARVGCVSRAVADAIACMPSGGQRKAAPTAAERAMCEAACEQGIKAHDKCPWQKCAAWGHASRP